MIPKIIHYCWFGNNPKTKLIEYCLNSWREYLPDYEIIEWNESNFDINMNSFVKKAASDEKWAFVSDYVRAYALYNIGGIYLDTDVEIKMSLDEFLSHGAFSGFETKGFPFTALWASEKGHIWPEKVLNHYAQMNNWNKETNTTIITNLLIDEFNVNPNCDEKQELEYNIVIYPSSHFCLDLNVNYATHHFNGSWLDEKIPYKNELHKIYFYNQYKELLGNTHILEELYREEKITTKELTFFTLKVLKERVKKRFSKK